MLWDDDAQTPRVEITCSGVAVGGGRSSSCGWAFIITHPEKGRITRGGAVEDSTEQRMQLLAALTALSYLEGEGLFGSHSVVLFSLNQTLIRGMNEWLDGWKENGWRRADGEEIGNEDIWHQLDELRQRVRVEYQHGRQAPLMNDARSWATSEARKLDAQKRGDDLLEW